MGTTGKCKVVPLDVEKGIMDSHLIRIRIKEELYIPELLALIINESYFVKFQFQVTSKGSIMSGLNSSIVKNLILFVPSILEQKRILEHIKSETKTLDIAISKAEREIELIKEYREAMIAEAVTGKMKL
jgi:type I restriction enzyme S subunit